MTNLRILIGKKHIIGSGNEVMITLLIALAFKQTSFVECLVRFEVSDH